MFTGLGKKQADTDLEMVVQGGMMSQKAKEGGKSVFYLPVMSSFFLLGFLFTEEPHREYLAETPLESGAGIW